MRPCLMRFEFRDNRFGPCNQVIHDCQNRHDSALLIIRNREHGIQLTEYVFINVGNS